VAGELITQAAQTSGAAILPIDSEHCAVHQCLRSGCAPEVRRLILTASGGPFRKIPRKQFDSITPEQALNHPIWKMGSRITIDSATMMNKGLEIIEAHWLFNLPSSQIDVLIHPESLVHSMIEFKDGSLVAQISVADMRLPIQYVLTYPERVPVQGDGTRLDLESLRQLHFEKPDPKRFPCLDLGRAALEQGGGAPCAMNAADEVAVESFLARRLSFVDIPRVIEKVMEATPRGQLNSMEQVLELDRESRRHAMEWVDRKAGVAIAH
jgi:1-deoxy-D-xylulose-5-phosphate reductoisomerase